MPVGLHQATDQALVAGFLIRPRPGVWFTVHAEARQ